MRTFLIFLFVALVSLTFYNPEINDFQEFLDEASEKEQYDRQTSAINQMFTKDTVEPGLSKPIYHTERNNFFVFSTYKISVSEEGQLLPPEETRYLGIATMFFELGGSSDEDDTFIDP